MSLKNIEFDNWFNNYMLSHTKKPKKFYLLEGLKKKLPTVLIDIIFDFLYMNGKQYPYKDIDYDIWISNYKCKEDTMYSRALRETIYEIDNDVNIKRLYSVGLMDCTNNSESFKYYLKKLYSYKVANELYSSWFGQIFYKMKFATKQNNNNSKLFKKSKHKKVWLYKNHDYYVKSFYNHYMNDNQRITYLNINDP